MVLSVKCQPSKHKDLALTQALDSVALGRQRLPGAYWSVIPVKWMNSTFSEKPHLKKKHLRAIKKTLESL